MFAALGFALGLGFGAPGAPFASGWPAGTFGLGFPNKVGVVKEFGIKFSGFDLDIGHANAMGYEGQIGYACRHDHENM